MYDADLASAAHSQPVIPDAAAIRTAAAEMAFSKPLIVNVLRGLIAETVVKAVLGPEWRWCSEDYHAWDFERRDGVRLEVKQSAARQTWARPGAPPSSASFDIAYRTGRYDELDWIAERRRWADLYVFAHHPICDDSADHCDPRQWIFHVVPTAALPESGQIGIAKVRALAPECTAHKLAATIDAILAAQPDQASVDKV